MYEILSVSFLYIMQRLNVKSDSSICFGFSRLYIISFAYNTYLFKVSPTSNNAVLRRIMEQEIDEQNRERKEEFL